MIILKMALKKWDGGHGRIDLAQEREGWRTLLRAVMNLRVPLNIDHVLTIYKIISFF
jgi:hypothetical protein